MTGHVGYQSLKRRIGAIQAADIAGNLYLRIADRAAIRLVPRHQNG